MKWNGIRVIARERRKIISREEYNIQAHFEADLECEYFIPIMNVSLSFYTTPT